MIRYLHAPSSHPSIIPLFLLLVFCLFLPSLSLSQEDLSAPSRQGVGVTQQQIQECARILQKQQVSPEEIAKRDACLDLLEKAQVAPEMMEALQGRKGLGGLTPEEIEAGKRLLDQQIGGSPETRPGEPATPDPAKKEEALKPEEDFFKKTEARETPSLEIFGHRLFTGPPSTFAPITAVPVSNDYIVGPGDEIKVLMWGRLDASYSLEVDNEGVINFPRVGPLTVAGLTFGEVKELIRARAEAITGVNVNVSMGKLRTIQVFVLGEVKSPGVYTVSSLATVTNALLASGGPTHLGSLRKVELKRQGRTVTVIDLYEFLLRGDTSADTRLMPGDAIFIPQCGPMVTVSGNVKRPAVYEMRDDRTLQNALALAGGLKPRAYNQRLQIERAYENRVQVVLDISYDELRRDKPVPLQDGDLIKVFSIHLTPVNAVYLYGNVLRPGEYAYEPGLRILDIMPDIESLAVDTYFDYALVKRYHHRDSRTELIPFHPGRLLLSREGSQNLPLKPLDEVYIFSKAMFEERRYAVITGEVRRPANYIIDDMRVRDLVFKAGNLTRDAYMPAAHLYRTDPATKEVTIQAFDLAKAMEGDPLHNFLLKDLDEVIIHSTWNYVDRYTVSVKGRVNKPGDYPFAANMTVRDLILVGGNVMESAYLEDAELMRFNIVDGKKVETSLVTFDLRKAMAGDPAHNLDLKPFDVVNVKEIPEWKEVRTAIVSGEVLFPGTYQIRREERLSSVIQRAGGFKEEAYLRGALFTRESVRAVQRQRLQDMIKQMEIEVAHYASGEAQATLSQEDIAAQAQFLAAQRNLIAKLKEAEPTGRVVISLLPTAVLRDASLDMVLESGDRLLVPKSPGTVNVLGAVYNPSALIYELSRADLGYYLQKTGGPTENAEKARMYVIRADGTVIAKAQTSWFGITWSDDERRWEFAQNFEKTVLYPGDTVLVPQKVVKPSFMKDFKDVTQILFQLAVTAGVLIQQVF
jgi:polysaccharide biosynthesis/export protein